MKSGFVAMVGRPNVGKSTLMNSILELKLAITSDKVGTTRNIINGIYNDVDSQIIFVDTPGIHKPSNKLDSMLNKKSYSNIDSVDLILFLVDGSCGIGRGDQFILEQLKGVEVPIFLIINKIDRMRKEQLFKEIEKIKDCYSFQEIIPISAKNRENIEELKKAIKKYLPEQERIFDEEELTNVSSKFIASEMVREKLLELTKMEVPHAITCYTEEFLEEENLLRISVLIVVERENLKKIVIGKQGKLLKEVGVRAREDLEQFFGKRVYLQTYVKTLKNWRDEEKYFCELGFKEDE